MDSFPYLFTLFLFTALAVMAWGARSYSKTEKALNKPASEKSGVRMAAKRNPAGKIMSDMVAERGN